MTHPDDTTCSNPELDLADLLREVRLCQTCVGKLPNRPRPVIRAGASARILVVGQAPGTRVQATGIPWNDPSGERLRHWMGLSREQFYDTRHLAIMPMGLCYPGRGRSGDLPPRPECASRWHQQVLEHLPDLELILLVGHYAQQYYLDGTHRDLTGRVAAWRQYLPRYLPLPHPSPRNQVWLRRHPWFVEEVVPYLQQRVQSLLRLSDEELP